MTWEVELWRVISHYDALDESITSVLGILRQLAPWRGVLIRQLERKTNKLVTIASATVDDFEFPHAQTERRSLTEMESRRLTLWLSLLGSAHLSDLSIDLAKLMGGSDGAFYVLSLSIDVNFASYVIVSVPDTSVSQETYQSLVQARGPLEVAIENGHRIHEVSRLKTALEADKTALLSRLARQDISEVVIGEKGGLRTVSEQLDQVAQTDVPVLILGETGSGKEVIARAIHGRSQRRDGPVVRVNCGAIPIELIDSELFGHERGAFTGAVAMRKGWFERADGGTLFLDEIGELQLAAQVRLLRVLQEGTLERVGGHQTISVDVRIVAATHRRLENMVSEGTFREDLWYRLSVFPILLPPLRDRRQDIAELARHFARNAGRRLGLSNIDLHPLETDIDLLLKYSWPGNVRELASVIERAAILGRGKSLEIAAALGSSLSPTETILPSRPSISRTHIVSMEAPSADGKFLTLDENMAQHIELALAKARGQIEGKQGAAELLGINPHTLRARMRKLGIDWNRYRLSEAN